MAKGSIHIIKASGDVVPFSVDKLRTSMLRSGAAEDVVDAVTAEIVSNLHEGMSTKEIYKLAFELLGRRQKTLAAKYSLKRAIMELGPSGFPFEKYISLVLKRMGYSVQINQFLNGLCVDHEVDVIAEHKDIISIIECKYHNLPGVICDVKVPLYVNSRFLDIKAADGRKNKTHECWVVTNTKFSYDAVRYGTCAGIRLLGWDYPEKGSLKELIDNQKLYPISCLTTLTGKEKQQILESGTVLCDELAGNQDILREHQITGARAEHVINEAKMLSSMGK